VSTVVGQNNEEIRGFLSDCGKSEQSEEKQLGYRLHAQGLVKLHERYNPDLCGSSLLNVFGLSNHPRFMV
jgi:hypothetical protein